MILNDLDMEKGQLPLVIRSTFVHRKNICQVLLFNVLSPHSPYAYMVGVWVEEQCEDDQKH